MKKSASTSIIVLSAALLVSSQSTAQQPWETPQGQQCIEQWARDSMARINSHNGSSEFNARKPWFINQWGVLNGNPRFGPTSNYAPDNFAQYRNKYHYMWDYWYAPHGTWRFPEWNAAGVPQIRGYVLNCLGGGQVVPPPVPPAPVNATGAARTGNDYVQRSETLAGDGIADWHFPFRLIGTGTVIGISVANISGQRSIWDTTPRNGNWLTAVHGGGRILNNSDGSVNFTVDGATDLSLYVADNGSLPGAGTRYRITVTFSDGRTVTLDPAVSRVAQAPPPSGSSGGGAITGHQPPVQAAGLDIVGPSEAFQRDGRNDWVFAIGLGGLQGTITGISIRNTDGQYSVWDTYPGNGNWLLAVSAGGGQVLNRSDGTVAINAAGLSGLNLLVCDQGSLSNGKTNFRVTLKMADGRTIERNIGRW